MSTGDLRPNSSKMVSDAAPQVVHPEDRELVERLAKLQNMHGQIHNLRGLLPERLLKSTRQALQNPDRSSPAKLTASLRETAMQGSKDIRKFSTDFRSEPMQQLWQKTSAEDFPQGRDAWTVDYEALIQSASQVELPPAVETDSAEATTKANTKTENIDGILKTFNESNPTIKIKSSDYSSTFPFHVTVGELTLHIDREEAAGKQKYRVSEQPENPSSLAANVAKAVNEGSILTSFEALLSMLASYKDLKFRPCNKCQAIFDTNVAYPVMRQRKAPASKDDTSFEWNALHRGCIT